VPTNHYPHLFQPGRIGKVTVRNRLVMPPMATNYGGEDGEVTDRMIRYYEERAKGGVGLIIVENAQVDYPTGKNVVRQHRIDNDKFVPGLRLLATAIKRHGAVALQQIHHAGRQTTPAVTEGHVPVAPSPVPCRYLGVQPRELTGEEIETLINKFAEAAARAKLAGFDGIELHGAHGYLIGQFMSPYTNRRVDQYGGTLEGRLRFPLEIIRRTREKVGDDFIIGFRFSADEFVPGGITLDEARQIAARLEQAGVDVLHVSAGIYESMDRVLEPMSYPEGWRVYLAEAIKQVVTIPVITVGVIRTPEMADRIIAEGKADFVAVGRGLITDPEFALKAATGRADRINRCISCNIGCVGNGIFASSIMRCTVNPAVGMEELLGTIPPAPHRVKVVVVGGGPAGMEAARIAAMRGHDVVLFEKSDRLGGQMLLAALPPHKDKINWFTDFLTRELALFRVRVVTGRSVSAEDVLREQPAAVIVATGAVPSVPDIPGVDGPRVFQAWDVLAGTRKVDGRRVVIVGGGQVGCETAEFLAEQGKQVTILEMLQDLALDMEPISRLDMLGRFKRLGINGLTGVTATAIADSTVRTIDRHLRTGSFPADAVVLAVGATPVNDLALDLAGRVGEVYVVGDAVRPRRIMEAAQEGALAAYSVGEAHKWLSPLSPAHATV